MLSLDVNMEENNRLIIVAPLAEHREFFGSVVR